jgi:hypothetical protein
MQFEFFFKIDPEITTMILPLQQLLLILVLKSHALVVDAVVVEIIRHMITAILLVVVAQIQIVRLTLDLRQVQQLLLALAHVKIVVEEIIKVIVVTMIALQVQQLLQNHAPQQQHLLHHPLTTTHLPQLEIIKENGCVKIAALLK